MDGAAPTQSSFSLPADLAVEHLSHHPETHTLEPPMSDYDPEPEITVGHIVIGLLTAVVLLAILILAIL